MNWNVGICTNGPATPRRKYPVAICGRLSRSPSAMSALPARTMTPPSTAVNRGPAWSRMKPSGILHSAFAAMPRVLIQLIALARLISDAPAKRPASRSTGRSAVHPYAVPEQRMTCRDASENSAARWVFVVDAIDGRRAASHCRVKGRETRQKRTNNQPQNEELSPRRGGGVGTMGKYPAVDSDARERGSGVRVARDL